MNYYQASTTEINPYYAASGDAADLQSQLTAAQNTLKDLTSKADAARGEISDWTSLNNRNPGHQDVADKISAYQTMFNQYKDQITTQQALIDSLTNSLNAANKVATTPALAATKVTSDANAATAALKKTRTIWIAAIGGTVVLLGGIFLIVRAKRKKAA